MHLPPPSIIQAHPGVSTSLRPGPRRHLPYAEVAPGDLVSLDGGIRVHRVLQAPLAALLAAAREAGVALKVGAGFRSMEAQRLIFESGARKKGLSPASYAWWTAPPGYSEHHTGLAVDFIDPERPQSNFTPALFVQTPGYSWLRDHAPAFGFELSFPEHSGLRVAFEPWHWRYVGDAGAQGIFAMARAHRAAQDGVSVRPR